MSGCVHTIGEREEERESEPYFMSMMVVSSHLCFLVYSHFLSFFLQISGNSLEEHPNNDDDDDVNEIPLWLLDRQHQCYCYTGRMQEKQTKYSFYFFCFLYFLLH